jgi:hypothetical protein
VTRVTGVARARFALRKVEPRPTHWLHEGAPGRASCAVVKGSSPAFAGCARRAPRAIFGRRLRRERCFTLGGGYAGGVLVALFNAIHLSSRVFHHAGFARSVLRDESRRSSRVRRHIPVPDFSAATTPLLRAKRKELHARLPRCRVGRTDPNAPCDSDGGIVRAVWRCGISLRAVAMCGFVFKGGAAARCRINSVIPGERSHGPQALRSLIPWVPAHACGVVRDDAKGRCPLFAGSGHCRPCGGCRRVTMTMIPVTTRPPA